MPSRLFKIGLCATISLSWTVGNPGLAQPASAVPQAGSGWERSRIVPRVAHHQHLLSPELSAMLSPRREAFPPVQLPAELRALIAQREQFGGDGQSSDLYAPDAQVIASAGGWVRQPASIREAAANHAGAHFLPNAFSINGNAGFVAGTIRWEMAGRDSLNFLWSIRKGTAGRWQIAAESVSAIPPPVYPPSITADDLIRDMNDAGIWRGVLLSTAYLFASAFRPQTADEQEKVRAGNDWTIAQARRYPGRLVAFCGINPLKDYAIEEMERCSKIKVVKGIKLHFGNAKLDVTNPDHLARIRKFFRATNASRMAIVVHLWTTFGDYGAKQAKIFLENILPEAPDVVVQIAHLAGAGPGYEGPEENALAVYADAITARDPRMKNVYFDMTTNVVEGQSAETTALIAKRLRQIGLTRILFGSDMPVAGNPPMGAQWATIRHKLPLTDRELRIVANNVAPYMR